MLALFRRISFFLGCLAVAGLALDGVAFAAAPAFGSRGFAGLPIVFPLVYPKLSSKHGNRVHPIARVVRHHNGVDLAAPAKSHVRVVTDGVVVFAGRYAGYGKLVTVKHPDNRISLYGHLDEVLVNVGQRVRAGELIGRVGSTGVSTGPHLHFEWRVNGESVDPLTVFPSLADMAMG